MLKAKAEFHIKAIKLREIVAEFARVRTTKGFSIENISAYISKLASTPTKNSLALRFNISVEASVFPDFRKLSFVERWKQD